jgi:hypothetical protein
MTITTCALSSGNLSLIPAISFHLRLFHFILKSAGIFLVASPIISGFGQQPSLAFHRLGILLWKYPY